MPGFGLPLQYYLCDVTTFKTGPAGNWKRTHSSDFEISFLNVLEPVGFSGKLLGRKLQGITFSTAFSETFKELNLNLGSNLGISNFLFSHF